MIHVEIAVMNCGANTPHLITAISATIMLNSPTGPHRRPPPDWTPARTGRTGTPTRRSTTKHCHGLAASTVIHTEAALAAPARGSWRSRPSRFDVEINDL